MHSLVGSAWDIPGKDALLDRLRLLSMSSARTPEISTISLDRDVGKVSRRLLPLAHYGEVLRGHAVAGRRNRSVQAISILPSS